MKEYLEFVKDFDELVSPQFLFLHFLGPEPSIKVWKNLEVVKKSKRSSSFLEISSFYFLLFFFFFFIFYFLFFIFICCLLPSRNDD